MFRASPKEVFTCNAGSQDQEGRIGKKQNVLQNRECPAKNPARACRVSALALGIRHHCGTERLIPTRFTLRPACPGVLVPMLPNLFFLAMMQGTTPPSLTAREILVTHMVQADNDRVAALAGYSGVRRYRFDNRKPSNRCPARLILVDMPGITE
jgi:hypothetical protein